MVVGRLAPSPTGAQHLGNARTFLLAWLAARCQGGRVILRIEDIDSPRVKPWAIEQAIDDLRWLGLDWDDGPYIQSERSATYQAALDRLIAGQFVYPCVCTRADIEQAASAPHQGQDGPIYPRTCADWDPDRGLPDPGTYCWRFRCRDREMTLDDLVLGRQSRNPARDLGDFPVTRKGGDAAYQLAVVVDDAAMGVDQVVRGDDLLPSAFRQQELYDALGWRAPVCGHVPLVVGPDGRRLAKRHGDTRLSWYREQGIAPEAIVGWAAASAGLVDAAAPIRPSELVGRFHWDRLRRAPTTVACDPFSP